MINMGTQLILTLILKDEAKHYELSQDKADEIFMLFNQSVIEEELEDEKGDIIKLIMSAKSFSIERGERQMVVYLDYPV